MSTFTIVGNLEHDPTRSTAGPVAFAVIVTRRWQNPTSLKFHEASSRFTVSCSGIVAQNALDGLRKSDRVIVTGYIEQTRGVLTLYASDVGLALSKHQVHPAEGAE